MRSYRRFGQARDTLLQLWLTTQTEIVSQQRTWFVHCTWSPGPLAFITVSHQQALPGEEAALAPPGRLTVQEIAQLTNVPNSVHFRLVVLLPAFGRLRKPNLGKSSVMIGGRVLCGAP